MELLQPPEPFLVTSRQQQLLDALDAAGSGLWQRSLEASGFSPAMVRSLETKGWVRRERRPLSTGVTSAAPLEAARPLTSEQEQVMQRFEAVPDGEGMLLWGITGSGKTEVYPQLAEQGWQPAVTC